MSATKLVSVHVRAKTSGGNLDTVTRCELPERGTDVQRGRSASEWTGSKANNVAPRRVGRAQTNG